MSGHSKWSTIKRKKGANDSKRAKIFSRLVKDVYSAAKNGGANPDSNLRLKVAIQSARSYNVPKDNIEKALKKVQDGVSDDSLELVYEIFGPSGVAILVECSSDNKNRTASTVRAVLSRNSATLAKSGAVSRFFSRSWIFTIDKSLLKNFEDFSMQIIDAEIEDLDSDEDNIYVICALSDFDNVQKKLIELKTEISSAEIRYVAQDFIEVEKSKEQAINKLLEDLEDLEDVEEVYHNMNIKGDDNK